MMYIFPFFFFLGPCIPAGHFVFTWIVQTLVIVYTGSVYGYVFMAMDICLDVDSWICMGVCLDVWLCFWMYGCVYGYGYVFGYVFGYVYGYRVSILREAWFNKYRGLPLLGARFHHHWDLLSSRGPFHHHWDLLSSRGPFHHHWDLLPHEAHLNDSPNFSNFSRQRWKNLPQYAMLNKFF
jgi:hypothetical protein